MKLEGKLDKIIERIIEGATFRCIAEEFTVSVSTVHAFLALPEHSARASAALSLSADQYADKAEEVLLNAPASKEELIRAKELAQHYRWKAGKRAPKKYGDKLDLTTDGEKLPASGAAVFHIIPASQRPVEPTNDDE